MNWAIFTAVVAALTLLVTIGGMVFIGGRMAQKIDENRGHIQDNCTRLNDHERRLGEHDVDIGRLHEWKDGFNAGASKLAHTGGGR